MSQHNKAQPIALTLQQAMLDPATFVEAEAIYAECFAAQEGTVLEIATEGAVSVDEVWHKWLNETGTPEPTADVICLVNYKGEDEGGLALRSKYPDLRPFRGKHNYT